MNFISISKKNNSIFIDNIYKKPSVSIGFHPKTPLHSDSLYRTVTFRKKEYVFAYNEFHHFFKSLPSLSSFKASNHLNEFKAVVLKTKDFQAVTSLFKVYFVFARNISLVANDFNFKDLVPLTLETIDLWDVLASNSKNDDTLKHFLAEILTSISQDVKIIIEDFKNAHGRISQLIFVKQVLTTLLSKDLSSYNQELEQLQNLYHIVCHMVKSFKALNVVKQAAIISDIRIKALTDSLNDDFLIDRNKCIVDGKLTVLKVSKCVRRLEEKRITELFAYSGINLSLPLYTFSSINTLRMNSNLSSQISWVLQGLETKVVAKPKIAPFITLFDVMHTYPDALNPILSKLQVQDHLKVFLCSIHQLLDLHPKNIAIKPVVEDESLFNDQFLLIDKKYDLSRIIMMFFAGVIKDTTLVYLNSTKKPVSIASYLPLKAAVNAPWEIQLFDLDFSIAESNLLNFYDIQKSLKDTQLRQTTIPLNNSILIFKDFANTPLTPQLISIIKLELKNLLNISFEKNVWPWNFIRKQDHSSLEEMIIEKAYHKNFSNSNSNLTNPSSISKIKTDFTVDLSDLNKHLDFWQKFDAMLADFGLSGWHGIMHINLLDPASKAERFKFAKALFPKDTVFQMQVRKARIVASIEYITCYEKVLKATTNDDPEKILQDIEKLVNIPGLKNPYELEQQLILLSNFKENPHIEDIMLLKDIFLDECRPTHFRLACVMYPLLSTFDRLKNLGITNKNAYEFLNGLNYFGSIHTSFEDCILRAKHKSFATKAEEITVLENTFLNAKNTQISTFFSYYGKFTSIIK